MSAELIAIIPAAGLSRRMGVPKLLLPWRGTTVIESLVSELQAAGVGRIYVVMRAADQALQTAVTARGAIPVIPEIDPPDMRSSVEAGLRAAHGLQNSSVPDNTINGALTSPSWLLIPADHPLISRNTVDALRSGWVPETRQILIPTYAGQRGHPTLFTGHFTREVPQIPAGSGLNRLVSQHSAAIREIPVNDPGVTLDLDTPADYQALLNAET